MYLTLNLLLFRKSLAYMFETYGLMPDGHVASCPVSWRTLLLL